MPGRRTPAQRRADRARGIDRFGNPLPRVAGTNPRSRRGDPQEVTTQPAPSDAGRDLGSAPQPAPGDRPALQSASASGSASREAAPRRDATGRSRTPDGRPAGASQSFPEGSAGSPRLSPSVPPRSVPEGTTSE